MIGVFRGPQVAGVSELDHLAARVLPVSVRIVDVREPDEFFGELGHLPRAQLIPLGHLLSASKDWDKSDPVLLVCRSGRRSRQGALALVGEGFEQVADLVGGMLAVAEAKNA